VGEAEAAAAAVEAEEVAEEAAEEMDQEETHLETNPIPTMVTTTKRNRSTAKQSLKTRKKNNSPSQNLQEEQPAHQVLGLPAHQVQGSPPHHEKEDKPEKLPRVSTGASSRQHNGCHENVVRHQQAPQPAWIGTANFNFEYEEE